MEPANMPETRRKLTTIFSADVQDYTRLMGIDEEGTLVTLKRYRDAMSAVIQSHGGRVINTWGDGLIAEFPSVVEAVRAAIDTQNELAGYNAGTPSEKQMLFRIGINLGDVIEVGDDIYGDGVNIAARLQGSALPGGIVISNTVYDQVRNKVTVAFDFLGPLQVKNVTEAVPSYSVRVGEAPAAGWARSRDVPQRPPRPPVSEREELFFQPGSPAMYRGLAGAAIIVTLVNLFTEPHDFWAKWPLTVFAIVAALQWSRTQRRFDRRTSSLLVMGLGLAAINVLTGGLWVQWPLLAIAVLITLRWLGLRR